MGELGLAWGGGVSVISCARGWHVDRSLRSLNSHYYKHHQMGASIHIDKPNSGKLANWYSGQD